MRALIVLALATVAIGHEEVARACSVVPRPEFGIDPRQGDDAIPPSAPSVMPIVRRFEADGCLDDEDSCGKRGASAFIELRLSTTDDRAPTEKIGYHVTFVDGDAPDGLAITDGPELALGGTLPLRFDPEDDSGFDVRISVRAVDQNGNYSEPTIVSIAEDGAALSCSSNRVDSHVAVWLALGFVLWPRRRRRTR